MSRPSATWLVFLMASVVLTGGCHAKRPGAKAASASFTLLEAQAALETLRQRHAHVRTYTATLALTLTGVGPLPVGRVHGFVAYAAGPPAQMRLTAYDFIGVRALDLAVDGERIRLWYRGGPGWEEFASPAALLAAHPEATPAWPVLTDPALVVLGVPSAIAEPGAPRVPDTVRLGRVKGGRTPVVTRAIVPIVPVESGPSVTLLFHRFQEVPGSERDAGITARDAGVSAKDAGVSAKDAGVSAKDAGVSAKDAGVPLPVRLSASAPRQGTLTLTLRALTVNEPLPAGVFEIGGSPE